MPLDFFDYLAPSGAEGTRKMRIVTGLIGAVLGGVMGFFLGNVLRDEPVWAGTNAIFGALIGGGLGALFSAFVILGLVLVVIFAGAVLWNVYVGGN